MAGVYVRSGALNQLGAILRTQRVCPELFISTNAILYSHRTNKILPQRFRSYAHNEGPAICAAKYFVRHDAGMGVSPAFW